MFAPILLLTGFFVLRLFLRKTALAVAGVLLLYSWGLTGGDLSVVSVFIWLLWYGVSMFLLLRVGLVAGCVCTIAASMLVQFPVTADFSIWYAGSGVFAIVVLLALAAFAFYTSLGGQKLFQGGVLED